MANHIKENLEHIRTEIREAAYIPGGTKLLVVSKTFSVEDILTAVSYTHLTLPTNREV